MPPTPSPVSPSGIPPFWLEKTGILERIPVVRAAVLVYEGGTQSRGAQNKSLQEQGARSRSGHAAAESRGVNVPQRLQAPRFLRRGRYYYCRGSSFNRAVRLRANPGRRPATSPSFPPTHPSVHSPRVQRAPLCARPGAGHWGGRTSLPPSCPGGCGWLVGDFAAERSRKPKLRIRREAPRETARLGRPGARVCQAARSPVRRSPPRRPLRRGSGGCGARREGLQRFESAQAARRRSHLFPPPAPD